MVGWIERKSPGLKTRATAAGMVEKIAVARLFRGGVFL
jgi:hypothetical protein